eukprot:TRINITY_DN21586_c0_g1_i2.p1 TRINITY_DN21586_c0_g1~~TRINITY_DN21586_c0_g1_i2.p1  ORF type:complete len:752 (+),score=200.18 TRINITY_DN21586_c0_g1_i2:23-2257(+)
MPKRQREDNKPLHKVGDEIEASFNGDWFPAVISDTGLDSEGEVEYEVDWVGDDSLTKGLRESEVRKTKTGKKEEKDKKEKKRKRPADETTEDEPVPDCVLQQIMKDFKDEVKGFRGKARTEQARKVFSKLPSGDKHNYLNSNGNEELKNALLAVQQIAKKCVSDKTKASSSKGGIAAVQIAAIATTAKNVPEFTGDFKKYSDAVAKQLKSLKASPKKTDKDPAPALKKPKKETADKKPKKDLPVRTPLQLYSSKELQNVQDANPGKSLLEARKILEVQWNELTDEERQPYENMVEEEKKRKAEAEATPPPPKKKKKVKFSAAEAVGIVALHNALHLLEVALRHGTLETSPKGITIVKHLKQSARKHSILSKLDFSEPVFTAYHRQALQEDATLRKNAPLEDVMSISVKPSRSTPRVLDVYIAENSPKIVKGEKVMVKDAKQNLTDAFKKLSADEKAAYEQMLKEQKAKRGELFDNIHKIRFLKGEERDAVSTLEKTLQEKIETGTTHDENCAQRFNEICEKIGVSATENPSCVFMLKSVSECTQHLVYHERVPMSTDDRNKAKKSRESERKNLVKSFTTIRQGVFGKLYQAVDVAYLETLCKGLVEEYKVKLLEMASSAESWDEVLFYLRDRLDDANGHTQQKRVPIHEKIVFSIQSFGSKIAPSEAHVLLPYESSLSLPRLPAPLPLTVDSSVRVFFGDIVYCWLNIYVFAKAFRLTRFPLHQFFEAVTSQGSPVMLQVNPFP